MPRKAPIASKAKTMYPHTTIWVAGFGLTLAVAGTSAFQTVRIENLETRLSLHAVEIARLSQKLGRMAQTVNEVCARKAEEAVVPTPAPEPTTTSLLPPQAGHTLDESGLKVAPSEESMLMARGSFSPDYSKYAGYDEATRGKLGIAVETMADKRVRHIVLFTKAESSGKGTPDEKGMSVRWLDDKTIQYDVLVTEKGVQTKKTETVTIGF